MRDALAEMRLPEANAHFLARFRADSDAVTRFAFRQKGFEDRAVLKALLGGFRADNPDVTDVASAVRASYPHHQDIARELLASSAEDRILGLRLLQIFPDDAPAERNRIVASRSSGSREESIEAASLDPYLNDGQARGSLPVQMPPGVDRIGN
jgi:hypothetical protein